MRVLSGAIGAVSHGLANGYVSTSAGSMITSALVGAGFSALDQVSEGMFTRVAAANKAKERSRTLNRRVDIMRSLGAKVVTCDHCLGSMAEPSEEEIALAGRSESVTNIVYISPGDGVESCMYFTCSDDCHSRFRAPS